jgi:hypothetical protein
VDIRSRLTSQRLRIGIWSGCWDGLRVCRCVREETV